MSTVGHRAKWGVIIPSTSTVVEHDFNMLTPDGVSIHAGRAYIDRPSMTTNHDAQALLDQMDASFDVAVRDVLTVQPDHLVIAMSAEIMRRGVAGGDEFVDRVSQAAGLPVTTGPGACHAALRALGVERIALVTPYQSLSDQITREYFTALGFKVTAIKGLRCTSATNIAQVQPTAVVAAMREVDSSDAEGIVQVGTNLSAVCLAAEAEHWLGKPTIAMNTATVWHALRRCQVHDRVDSFGTLLRDH